MAWTMHTTQLILEYADVARRFGGHQGSLVQEMNLLRHAAEAHRNAHIVLDLRFCGSKTVNELPGIPCTGMRPKLMLPAPSTFVRDEYGRRTEAFGVQAREIVAHGMASGFGQDDIAAAMAAAATRALVNRSAFYWEVAAGAFVGRGRSYAEIGAYEEAGVRHYRVEAILDERTSTICRALHGTILPVADALRSFCIAEKLDDPEALKSLNPWPIRDASGEFFVVRGGRSIKIGVRSQGNLTSDCASRLGLLFPPYHGLCRTTTVPI